MTPYLSRPPSIRSSLSLPIADRTETVGALNLCAGPPGAFETTDRTVLRQATGEICAFPPRAAARVREQSERMPLRRSAG